MKDRFALVVGATGAIGQAVTYKLAEQGWSVYIHYVHSKDVALQMVQLLQSLYPEQIFSCHSFLLEQTNKESFHFIFELDAIVFAQGTTIYKEFIDTSNEDRDLMINQYVVGPQMILQHLYSRLRGGAVVFIGSIFGTTGASWEVVYSTAKAAQIGMMKSLAKEWAQVPVRVNMVSPGFIESGIHTHLTPLDIEVSVQEIPLKRLGKPQEVAHAVFYLLSDESSYITGQIIAVNGGWHLHG